MAETKEYVLTKVAPSLAAYDLAIRLPTTSIAIAAALLL